MTLQLASSPQKPTLLFFFCICTFVVPVVVVVDIQQFILIPCIAHCIDVIFIVFTCSHPEYFFFCWVSSAGFIVSFVFLSTMSDNLLVDTSFDDDLASSTSSSCVPEVPLLVNGDNNNNKADDFKDFFLPNNNVTNTIQLAGDDLMSFSPVPVPHKATPWSEFIMNLGERITPLLLIYVSLITNNVDNCECV